MLCKYTGREEKERRNNIRFLRPHRTNRREKRGEKATPPPQSKREKKGNRELWINLFSGSKRNGEGGGRRKEQVQ